MIRVVVKTVVEFVSWVILWTESALRSLLFPRPRAETILGRRLEKALTFQDFRLAALTLDEHLGRARWKLEPRSEWYDHRLLTMRFLQLRGLLQAMETGDEEVGEADILFYLRSGCFRNLGGYCNHPLLHHCLYGSKDLIENYVSESCRLIRSLASPEPAWPRTVDSRVKHDFLVEMLQSYGRTALVLHGGASFGASHLGVAKALHDQHMLPRIICGSYIGALVASLICVQVEADLPRVLSGATVDLSIFQKDELASWRRKLLRFLKYGHVFDVKVLEASARSIIGEWTFKEAFKRSGLILNITVYAKRRSEVPVLLNYLTAPDVLVWSAACASCAVPGLFQEAVLLIKDATGTIVRWNPSAIRFESAQVVNEIPLSRLTEMFNANNFIVSHVPSFWSARLPSAFSPPEESKGGSLVGRLVGLASAELSHRVSQLAAIGLLPAFVDRLANFLRQPSLGDIQITPRILFRDLRFLLGNPTPDFLQYCLRKGERAAWLRLTEVRIRCAIEFEMERALKDIRRMARIKSNNGQSL